MSFKRLSRSTIYQNRWVNLYVDRVEFPNGRIVESHHLLDFDYEAVAVVVENERNEILFVNAYRYTTESVNWEIPAGGMEHEEGILDAARREVLEESGFESSEHELLYSYLPMNGIATQVFHIVRCKAGKLVGEFDKNEIKETAWLPRSQVEDLIRRRVIKDGYSLSALLLHFSGLTEP